MIKLGKLKEMLFYVQNKKKALAASLFLKYESIFRCPICLKEMKLINEKSLICSEDHCFDLSKRGYVNFLVKPLKTKYDRPMFESRNIISKSGFFEPLCETVVEWINMKLELPGESLKILDAGCGEGSHLISIGNMMNIGNSGELLRVGIDISKEGIIIASKEYPGVIWCVADIARCPLKGENFDVILNILSPSNYSEFQRLLSNKGVIIKVIPGSDHLKELRTVFYRSTEKQKYCNTKIIKHFRSNIEVVEIKHLKYKVSINKDLIKPLIYMTPLSWEVPEKDINKAVSLNLKEITVDLSILFGKSMIHT